MAFPKLLADALPLSTTCLAPDLSSSLPPYLRNILARCTASMPAACILALAFPAPFVDFRTPVGSDGIAAGSAGIGAPFNIAALSALLYESAVVLPACVAAAGVNPGIGGIGPPSKIAAFSALLKESPHNLPSCVPVVPNIAAGEFLPPAANAARGCFAAAA